MKEHEISGDSSARKTGMQGVQPIAAALKALSLLNLLGTSNTPQRLADLTKASGESRATTYQKLVTLIRAGWVEQTEDARYRLAFHAVLMGQAALEQANIGERATSVMQELVHAVNETASLGELSGLNVRLVRRIEAEMVVRAQVRVGTLLSLNESASGRVLTAHASATQLQHLREKGGVLASAALLSEVRANGYAVSSGKDTPGARTLAMPVFDATGNCVLALSVVSPAERFQPERYMEPLRKAAAQLNGIMRGAVGE